jgi:tetratricopeptide (TPR) repeat protein
MLDEVDSLFQDAIDSLRRHDKVHAKDVLTRLLKTDQKNVTYWIWMSAAVETAKERIYCLQTALKLDPENATAKRGLILLGVLSPDENVQPFPLNHPRAWEDKILLANERPKESFLAALMSNPLTRLLTIVVVGSVVVGVAVLGLTNPRSTPLFGPINNFSTTGPTPTFTLTPTFINASPQPTSAHAAGPTPLAVLLNISYTPTPLYVNTPRSPLSQDIYSAAKVQFQRGNWDQFIASMNQIATAEPKSADVPYYIGEANRFKGDCRSAQVNYNDALRIDSKFAPAYLGLARARLCIDPGADTTPLYQLAIQADPNYGEVYLDRGLFFLQRKGFNAALPDLVKAGDLMPNSALVQLAYAQAYLINGDNAKALAAAQKANSIDLTLLTSYYVLGQADLVNQKYQEAIQPLETYLIYEPDDGSAFVLLGEAYAQTGNYKLATDTLNKALALDPNQRQAYVYLGLADLQLGKLSDAEINYKKALQYFPDSFEAEIGLTQVFYQEGVFGSAYLQAETSKSKATNPTQTALAIYWRALSQEGRGSLNNAIADFKTLLSMPANVMTAQMRKTAQDHLSSLLTPRAPGTTTPTATTTPVPTKTP